MNKSKFKDEISKIEDIEKEFNVSNDLLGDLFGVSSRAENNYLSIFYKMRDIAIANLAKISDDNNEWILWYFDEVLTNKDHSLDVTYDDKKYVCANSDDLWDIIKAMTNQK